VTNPWAGPFRLMGSTGAQAERRNSERRGDLLRVEATRRGWGNPLRRYSLPGVTQALDAATVESHEHIRPGAQRATYPAHDAGMDILMAPPVISFR
jgi:hypothetical protein